LPKEKSMPVTIPATQAHRQLGELIRRVYSGKEHFVVEKDGLPVAALISITEYEQFLHELEQRQKRLKRFQENAKAIGEEVQRRALTEDDIEAQVEAVREQLYQEHYGDHS
jgi:prevent-host-death family protein